MKVVITGGCGFLGQMIAREILKRGELRGPDGKTAEVDNILLFDQLAPVTPFDWAAKEDKEGRVTTAAGDISDKETVSALVDRDDISVFHLASVVSAGGEKDFDLAMRVNLQGGLNILEAARARAGKQGGTPRLVFSSSLAVFGGADLPKEVDDWTRHTPETTYGMTKAFGELAINDYTRKGFIDGRTVRLPTIVIRPGVPNAAASGWASGIFREPLQGKEHILPVHDGFYMMLLGYRSAVQGFLAVHEADGNAIGTDRSVALPNKAYAVAEMIEALERVAADKGIKLGPITRQRDESVEAICGSWPLKADATRAKALGCPEDVSLEHVIQGFIEDFL
jgi:nucleoside-diphosphate-sugar epimerase